ncbi:hypothetical protein [Chryseobacterium sp. MFBS3-17]|uniref:hypothetical protein n=1 Tax=Chryseobacterium sp. MFBS3-17 TaxID=2886689 RepID=UPI001D0DEEAA|nr:hypothetical protein [Chryseobacterium sp. MFBS3-17]MCC2590599.1 hypothetical protein [Chryseobacterium sp. MFBS3-17]
MLTILSSFWPGYQFFWFVFFVIMLLIGFWCIIMFFGVVIPMWLTSGLREYFGKTKPFDPEEVRRKTLPEQGAEVIYSNPKGEGPFLHGNHGHH